MNTSQNVQYSNNEFAAFPLNRTWKSIHEYAEGWDRAEGIHFLADRCETFLLFHYRGYAFCIYDDEATLRICVEDASCPREVLAEVSEHFAAFLPSKPWDNAAAWAMLGD
jgi:hypothetical protein